MVEGFENPIVLATNGNFPYMPKLLEGEGYSKKVDCVVYKLVIPDKIPDFYQNIYERVSRREDIYMLEFKSKRQLKPYIKPILRLLNETFEDIFAFVPFEEYEMEDFANRYIFLLDPNFIKAILNKDGEVVAFIVSLPNISEGIKAANGKMLPLAFSRLLLHETAQNSWIYYWEELKRISRSGPGCNAGSKTCRNCSEKGNRIHRLASDTRNQHGYAHGSRKMGGVIYKRFRISRNPSKRKKFMYR